MIYGYIRVSSDKQTVENQRFEIIHFAETNNLSIERLSVEPCSMTRESLVNSWKKYVRET